MAFNLAVHSRACFLFGFLLKYPFRSYRIRLREKETDRAGSINGDEFRDANELGKDPDPDPT